MCPKRRLKQDKHVLKTSEKEMSAKWRRNAICRSFIFVGLPLLLGSCVYVLLRVKRPILINNYQVFEQLRLELVQISPTISNNYFLKYNFPDAAWAFALMAAILLSLEKEKAQLKNIYITVTVLLVVLFETLQIDLISGTFDALDLTWELIAVGLCVVILRNKNYDKKLS
jgi:hypothetical protein